MSNLKKFLADCTAYNAEAAELAEKAEALAAKREEIAQAGVKLGLNVTSARAEMLRLSVKVHAPTASEDEDGDAEAAAQAADLDIPPAPDDAAAVEQAA